METLWDPPPTNLTCAPFSSMDTSLMTSVCVVFERVIRYSDPLRIIRSFMVQEPEHTAESSTVKVASSPTCAPQFTRPVFTDAVGSEQINVNIFTGIHWFKTVSFSLNMKTFHNNNNNNKNISHQDKTFQEHPSRHSDQNHWPLRCGTDSLLLLKLHWWCIQC